MAATPALWRRRVPALLLALWLATPAAGAPPSQEERAAEARLAEVRTAIRRLAAERQAISDEHDQAGRALREQAAALAEAARAVAGLDADLEAGEARLADLARRQQAVTQDLAAQREGLAALLRAAHAQGRHASLRLLLQQDDLASMERAAGWQRWLQRERLGRIQRLRAGEAEYAALIGEEEATRARLLADREAHARRASELEAARDRQQQLLAAAAARLADHTAQAARLERDQRELVELLERLRDVFADIPDELSGARPFAAGKGRLPWPVPGRVVTGFGARGAAGAPSKGLLLAAPAGTRVQAVAHGRVAFADWLRGYGLLVILDHGDGWLSLYGQNETLLREVGDWVQAGEAVATSGRGEGSGDPALWFELRRKGQAVDPRPWLAARKP